MKKEITIKDAKHFLKWYKTIDGCPFNKKGLWEIQKECDTADLEVYWNYDDELTEDQTNKILEDGLDGYNEVENDLYEHNYDYICELINNFLKSISIDADMLSKPYKNSIMETWSCGEDEVVDYAREDLIEYIKDNFELPVNLNFDELIRKTSGEIWIDDEDTCYFEIFSRHHICSKSEELLFFGNSEYDHLQNDLYENAFGVDLEWLCEPIEFSVCIAGSLEEYVEMLTERTKDVSGEIQFSAVIETEHSTKTVTMAGVPYCSLSPSYSEPEGPRIDLAEDGHRVDSDEADWGSFEVFVDGAMEIVRQEAVKYIEKHLHNPKRLDAQGRTLMHYALVLQDEKLFGEVVDGLAIHKPENLYKADKWGISPFFMISDNVSKGFEAAVYDAVYFPLIELLPIENETAGQWSVKSTLKAEFKSRELIVVERLGVPKGADLNDEALLVFNLTTKRYEEVKISKLDHLTPSEPVEIFLDGTVAA